MQVSPQQLLPTPLPWDLANRLSAALCAAGEVVILNARRVTASRGAGVEADIHTTTEAVRSRWRRFHRNTNEWSILPVFLPNSTKCLPAWRGAKKSHPAEKPGSETFVLSLALIVSLAPTTNRWD